MSISTTNMQSSHTYSNHHTRKREITAIDPQQPKLNSQTLTAPRTNIDTVSLTFLSQTTSQSQPMARNEESTAVDAAPEADIEELDENDIPVALYQRKLIIEKFFGVKAELSTDMKNIGRQAAEDLPESNNGDEMITLDGQQFSANEQVQVTDYFSRTQQLNYQVSGEFEINDKNYKVSFELDLYEQKELMSQRTAVASQLKDPLLIQFGEVGLGGLNGQSADIDINQDSSIDQLPMFDGDVGYLVFDKNNNGKADTGAELFGPQTGNGFGELGALDSNGNGFVDRDDEAFDQLYLWQIDSSGNENWTSLADTNIEGISLNSSATPFNFYDESDQLQARLTQSSIAMSSEGRAYGVHQVDVRI